MSDEAPVKTIDPNDWDAYDIPQWLSRLLLVLEIARRDWLRFASVYAITSILIANSWLSEPAFIDATSNEKVLIVLAALIVGMLPALFLMYTHGMRCMVTSDPVDILNARNKIATQRFYGRWLLNRFAKNL